MKHRAFSLVELVLVVSIVGTLAAIAAPRISNMAKDSQQSAVQKSLTSIRKAIDAYYAEHGRYPGYNPGTGTPNHAAFVNQLTMYTNALGEVSDTPGYPYIYGPYLRAPLPKNPINNMNNVWVKPNLAASDPTTATAGWVTVLSHGYFGIVATEGEMVIANLDTMKGLKLKSFP